MASSTRRGRWTRDEQLRYIEGVKLYGKDWNQVARFVGTRTAHSECGAALPDAINVRVPWCVGGVSYHCSLLTCTARQVKSHDQKYRIFLARNFNSRIPTLGIPLEVKVDQVVTSFDVLDSPCSASTADSIASYQGSPSIDGFDFDEMLRSANHDEL